MNSGWSFAGKRTIAPSDSRVRWRTFPKLFGDSGVAQDILVYRQHCFQHRQELRIVERRHTLTRNHGFDLSLAQTDRKCPAIVNHEILTLSGRSWPPAQPRTRNDLTASSKPFLQ